MADMVHERVVRPTAGSGNGAAAGTTEQAGGSVGAGDVACAALGPLCWIPSAITGGKDPVEVAGDHLAASVQGAGEGAADAARIFARNVSTGIRTAIILVVILGALIAAYFLWKMTKG